MDGRDGKDSVESEQTGLSGDCQRRRLTSSPLPSEEDKGQSRGGGLPEVTELRRLGDQGLLVISLLFPRHHPAAVLFPSSLFFWSPEHLPSPSI